MDNNNDLEKMRIKNLRYNNVMLGLLLTISYTTLIGTVICSPTTEPVEPVVVEAEPIETPVASISDGKQESSNQIDESLAFSDEEYISQDTLYTDIVVGNEYSGMKVSNELEDEVKRLANLYGVPYEIILAIGERESAGEWNNEGVVSSTSDYGVFQINKCNLGQIEENLGYTKEDLLYDPFKNAEACIFLVKGIMDRDDIDSIEEVFGMYNAWTNWRSISSSVDYSNGCCEIINKYFPDFTYGNQIKY